MQIETLESSDLLFLPNLPREELDDLLIQESIDPETSPSLALIAPYDPNSEHKTAIMADCLRHWYHNKSIGIVMPDVPESRICQLVRSFRFAGFSPIVFMRRPNIARLKAHLTQEQWYHVMDLGFEIVESGVKGHWTRSEK